MAAVKTALLGMFALLIAARPAVADDHKQLLADADRIAGEVSKLRGLKLRQPIKRGVMNKEQITERLLKRVSEEYKPEEIANEEMTLKRLGMIPHEANYLSIVIELLKAQIAGFYDPDERHLYIADWMSGGEEVMAHEIDHALQDQHFDLKRWMSTEKKNADATLARQALVEGDGTALMLEFITDKTGKKSPWEDPDFAIKTAGGLRLGMGMMGDVPLVLKESLVFPYINGLKFVAHARATRPWRAIDAMYKRPPLSTEQIVHPEKYESYERPIEVRSAQPAALRLYRRGYDNVTGEMQLWLVLREHGVDEALAKTAVAGWGGDRIAVYDAPGIFGGFVSTTVLVSYSVWDSEPDAVEFLQALTAALPSLAGTPRTGAAADVVQHTARDGSLVVAERRGDAVLLVIGALPATADELRAQVWKTWTVNRR